MEEIKLMPEQEYALNVVSYWTFKFKEAMVTKAPYVKRWQKYLDAYNGDYFKNSSQPDYKSDYTSNYIFSIIETIRPIMLDNDPKFQAMPRQPEGVAFSADLQEALNYEWDREKMNKKLYRELITTLTLGTSIFYIPWNSEEKNVNAIPVSPFNFFPDPLATTIQDMEHCFYATYRNVDMLKRLFPAKASMLHGSDINHSELVFDNSVNAKVDNQVLVVEAYMRDHSKGYAEIRTITFCPDLGVLLSDELNPYQDKTFPFRTFKDYDIPGKFWGEGEVHQLLSPQKHMNDLNNAIIDNAKTTANVPWIVDKNSGIPEGKITSRPGLIIRKNPGTEVRRDAPPSMPAYVPSAVDTFKSDMEQISGIFDSLKGNSDTGVYTAQGVLALQEAGQARVRLKVKLLEDSLGEIATLWFYRMRQYWADKRFIRTTRMDGTYNIREFNVDALGLDYDIKITAGSTMPVNRGAMLDLLVRLSQTPMPDGQNLVDREAVATYLPEEIKASMLRRMNGQNSQVLEQVQQVEQQVQQMQQEDAQDHQILDQLTSTIEDLNGKILQLMDKNARMEEERKKEQEATQIRTTSYNEGYKDAEKQAQPVADDTNQEDIQDDHPLSEEMLTGLENLTDDQLSVLMQENPQLIDLLQQNSVTEQPKSLQGLGIQGGN